MTNQDLKTVQDSLLVLSAPLSGTVRSIEASADPVFAQRIVGDGIVIDPSDDLLVAPCAGTVSQLHDARHAIAIKADNGIEILMHIGIDTVTMKGEGFAQLVKLKEEVKPGHPLIRFDMELIRSKSLDPQTVVILTTGEAVKEADLPRKVVVQRDELCRVIGKEKLEQGAESEGAVTTEAADVVIPNPMGLHARPAAQLARLAKRFASSVTILSHDSGEECNATSVTAVMGLQTRLNSALTVITSGPDAREALAAITQAIEAGLGEEVSASGSSEKDDFPDEPPLLQAAQDRTNTLSGVKAAQGMAVGNLVFRKKELPGYPQEGVSVEDELLQLTWGLSTAKVALNNLVKKLVHSGLETQSEVFLAHIQLLDDPALSENSKKLIRDGHSAMYAWHQSFLAEAQKLRQLDNPLLVARAADIEDVGLRVLRRLMGVEEESGIDVDDSILVMEDVTPSEVVALDLERIIGLCTLQGGSTSHAAILAGSLGLPYLVNVSDKIFEYQEGSRAILNCNQGTIQLTPSEAEVRAFLAEQQQAKVAMARAQESALNPAITLDGTQIEVAANIASVKDVEKAVANGAEGIGLVRSEFLYMDRVSEPAMEEQVQVYSDILKANGKDHSCIIRTLDVGGDKPLPYLPLPKEENPFLGERGIRIGLNRPKVLRKQVRAILQASKNGKARIMFPMIASLEELRAVKKLVREEQELLEIEDIEIGIMIEVPAAATMADLFAKEVDFFSVGTNDLTQYVLAMDRGHPKLAAQVDALHPAVLRLIYQTAQASIQAGKWTGICGSIASDPNATAILIGLGVKELSVSVPMLPLVKAKIRALNLEDCKALAQKAMQQSTTAAVRALLKQNDSL